MKFFRKSDIIKWAILGTFSIGMWIWVGYEYSKPDGIDWRSGSLNSQSNAIEITEVGDQKIIKNSRLNFEVSINKDWNIQTALNRKIVASSDSCKINFETARENLTFQQIIEDMKENFEVFTIKKYEEKVFKLDNKPALEILLDTEETGKSANLFVLNPPEIHSANLYFIKNDGCANEWEDFKANLRL